MCVESSYALIKTYCSLYNRLSLIKKIIIFVQKTTHASIMLLQLCNNITYDFAGRDSVSFFITNTAI